MGTILLCAGVTCAAALFLGQAALRLAGASEWSWLAPAVGLSVAMLVATAATHVPGRCVTTAVVLAALSLAAAVWCLLSPPHRPPLPGLLAALPVAFLTLVPFLSAGRGGILGVTVDNDMAAHLIFVESIVSSATAAVAPLPREYPLGPHSMVALLGKGFGVHSDLAFPGWTMALPLINAWTVQAVVRRGSWLGRFVLATVVALPFLVAAYYAEGSFKEVAQGGFVLAMVLSLSGCGPRLGIGRWVPVALLVAGMVSVFSVPGLLWPVVIVGAWLLALLAIQVRRQGFDGISGIARRELPAVAIGLGVLVLALLPQAQRIWNFVALRHGSGIPDTSLGNLVGPLPGWEAFGVWSNQDFRLPASPAFTAGMWTAFVLGLVLFGAYWAIRRRRWMLPLAAAAALGIWRFSEHSQSPYVSAKALVIASPLLLLLAALPLVDREPGPRPRWPWLLVPLLGLVLVLRVGSDDLRALRFTPVGPTDHARQLQSFRSPLAGKRTLFLGNDEFVSWELAGASVQPVALATLEQLPTRPRKRWEDGQPLDFDSLAASTMNEFEWIVSPREAASSAPPPELHLVRSTDDFELWKRIGRIRPRSILNEGQWPGAVLDCETERGRALLAGGGVAAVRRLPIVATVPPVAAGETVAIRLTLPRGSWELETPYKSPYPVEVSALRLSTTLPANLDRVGPRLPIGRVVLRQPQSFRVTFHVGETALAPATASASFDYVVATPAEEGDRIIPLRQACGQYVDWYRAG